MNCVCVRQRVFLHDQNVDALNTVVVLVQRNRADEITRASVLLVVYSLRFIFSTAHDFR